MRGDPFATYDNWLASPYSEGITGQVEDDYDRYVETYWDREKAVYNAESERLMAQHDDIDVTWDVWRTQAEDDLLTYQDFYEAWMEKREEEERDRYFEQRYPDARI